MDKVFGTIIELFVSSTARLLDVNPKIIDDELGYAISAMIVVALVTYLLSRPTATHPNPRAAGLVSASMFLFFFCALQALTRGVLPFDPQLSALFARYCFVGLFAGFAGTVSWAAARLLN
jgi:hypothetical protein